MAKESPTPPVPEKAEPAPESKPKGPLIKIAIIAAVLLLQIVGSYVIQKNLFFSTAGPEEADAAHVEQEPASGEHADTLAKNAVQIVMLDEIVVNPANTAGRRYLAAVVGLQSASPAAETEVGDRLILIRDAVIQLLSSKTLAELSSIAYRDTLKYEIRDIVNTQLPSAKIDNVVFSEYVLQ